MSTFEKVAEETGDEREWSVFVYKLRAFLIDEATTTHIDDGVEHEEGDNTHAAYLASEAVGSGDFEAAAIYLDKEIEKVEGDMKAAQDNQERLAPLEVRKSTLETLRSGLERQ